MKKVIKEISIAVCIAIGIMCTALTAVGVIHDLSDGKIDGTRFVNGCTTEED